ncbi:MAG: hypothetical protein II971_00370 [Firmicutes bacterium]|nr:hypothetical protein [Bacillota bacterium]
MTAFELTGLRLEEAAELLERDGISYSVEKIEPFYRAEAQPLGKGSFRIVRVREAKGGLALTVCRVPDGTGAEV